jgi:D-glycero-alpha-D-manno-heptose-7-phosphate kinase
MLFRSKAPLRLGLAGGGTDVSPYCDLYGGAILNATISLYARAHLELLDEPVIELVAADRGEREVHALSEALPLNGTLDLLKGVYNRVQRDHPFPLQGFRLTTHVDAPAGSGLGTSSTLVVAIIGVFAELLRLPMGEYDIARYAYDIERIDLGLAGGRQDQYAATFGGVNYMEFYDHNKVIVNPLRVKPQYLDELENNLVLYYTDTTRASADIITEQQRNVTERKSASVEAMHQLKEQSRMMKEALLQGRLDEIGQILDFGFRQKRLMAANISNDRIEGIYASALAAGALGGKISGAGGGGFMMFYCPGTTRYAVSAALESFGGVVRPFAFSVSGLTFYREGAR